jgi:apolipoprotein N-acyltransferase
MVASGSLIPQSESTDPGAAADIVALYAQLVGRAAGDGTQVVVMPERIIGVTPRYESDVVRGFQRTASMSHVWLVVGINQIGRTPKRNIAVVFGPDGSIVASYAKHHPIPSLEWDYQAGSEPAIFDAPWGRTAVVICQDLDFPDTARELATHDVRVVMAPASDWRGSELIHQRMAVVRGVESGFSLARAARGGMVSATDSRGRQIAARASVHGEDALAIADLPLSPGRTLYSRSDDSFAYLCVIFTILLMLRLAVSIWQGRALDPASESS